MKKNKITLSHHTSPLAIGAEEPTALNLLLGFNTPAERELEYQKISQLNRYQNKINVITDLSTCRISIKESLWYHVLQNTDFIAALVPVYHCWIKGEGLNKSLLLESIIEAAENGVSLITIHPTPSRTLASLCKDRIIPITSRGGGMVLNDLILNNREINIYLELLPEIIEISVKHNMAISIGTSFRSASIIDSFDAAYQAELIEQIKIADYITAGGGTAIIETPGHASPHNITLICDYLNQSSSAPIMPLGPMPTDIGMELDDVAAAIGAVLMGTNHCADLLSIVTSIEHTGGLPDIQTLLKAVDIYTLAKHIIDISKINDCKDDKNISEQRRSFCSCISDNQSICTRCSEYCPLILKDLW